MERSQVPQKQRNELYAACEHLLRKVMSNHYLRKRGVYPSLLSFVKGEIPADKGKPLNLFDPGIPATEFMIT